MARRIRWQILIATVTAALVFGLMAYLALTTAAVAKPLEGGVFVEYETSTPRQLNPLLSTPISDPVAADLRALLFDGLMRIGPESLPEPALLQSRPELDETGTVYTFTLRSGVRWHDGEPLTVDDVLFTLRAVQSPGFVGDPQTGGIWRNVLLERIDQFSFRAILQTPLASFLSYATFPILPAHLLGDLAPEQWASTAYNLQPIGTGPYRLASPISGQNALLKANGAYFDGRPFLDSIEFRFDQNQQDALTAISRSEAVGFGLNSTNEQSRANTPRGAIRHAIPLAAYTTLTFNTRTAPLSDLGLRRALALGTDRDAVITQALGSAGQRLDTPLLPGWWASDPTTTPALTDATAAGEALTSLGYDVGADGVRVRDGQTLALVILTDDAADHVAAAGAIAAQWGALGIQTTVEQVEAAVLEQRLRDHDFAVALHGWQRQGPDPDVLYALWHSSGVEDGFNYAGIQDLEIDDQLTIGRESNDLEARQAAYRAFERRWVELAPGVTLYQPLYLYTTLGDLGGVQLDPEQSTGDITSFIRPLLLGREERFRNIVGWYLRSGREIQGDLRQAP